MYSTGILKRIFDLVISLLALIIVSPLLLILAIAIRLESKGSPFFKQMRAGKNRSTFMVYKLRTMVQDAGKIGPEITQANDPRITKVGWFLRRTSLDELPQILNVLFGDMSFVGPRPEVVSIAEEYDDYQKQVLNYKPGITGISQVNGRAALPIPEKIKMEVEYYKQATFLSDLIIILKTPWVLITNKGNIM
jgi:lipopolysaccharide/colanic/teichoic acid biosynthesis glycosyltransferase